MLGSYLWVFFPNTHTHAHAHAHTHTHTHTHLLFNFFIIINTSLNISFVRCNKFFKRLNYNKFVYMHSVVYGSAPSNIVSQFTINEYGHSHMLSSPQLRNNLLKTSLLYLGSTVWNNLCRRLKSIANKHTFKMAPKEHLLNDIT